MEKSAEKRQKVFFKLKNHKVIPFAKAYLHDRFRNAAQQNVCVSLLSTSSFTNIIIVKTLASSLVGPIDKRVAPNFQGVKASTLSALPATKM
jgi:hypothetical protein